MVFDSSDTGILAASNETDTPAVESKAEFPKPSNHDLQAERMQMQSGWIDGAQREQAATSTVTFDDPRIRTDMPHRGQDLSSQMATCQVACTQEQSFKQHVTTERLSLEQDLRFGNSSLADLSAAERADRELVRAAVQGNPRELQYASEVLRKDKAFVRSLVLEKEDGEVVTIRASALKYAHRSLLKDRNFIEELSLEAPGIFEYVHQDLRNNFLFVAKLVNKQAEIFRYLPERFRNNQRILEWATKDDLSMLQYASEQLRGNREFIRGHFHAGLEVMLYASEELQTDAELWLEALSHGCVFGPHPLYHKTDIARLIPKSLAQNSSFVQRIRAEFPELYPYLCTNLPKDFNSGIRHFKMTPNGIWAALPETLKHNRDFALQVMDFSPLKYLFLPPELQRDPDIIVKSTSNAASIASNIPADILSRDLVLRICNCSLGAAKRLLERTGKLSLSDGQKNQLRVEIREQIARWKEAYRILDIRGLERFSNSREIIRNRYHVSSPAVREQLEDLMGKDFFDGASDHERPLCIICHPSSASDHNQAFRDRDSSFADIDRLTATYRVLFYEVRSEQMFADALYQATEEKRCPADLLIVNGHGQTDKISLAATGEVAEEEQAFWMWAIGKCCKIFRALSLMTAMSFSTLVRPGGGII